MSSLVILVERVVLIAWVVLVDVGQASVIGWLEVLMCVLVGGMKIFWVYEGVVAHLVRSVDSLFVFVNPENTIITVEY